MAAIVQIGPNVFICSQTALFLGERHAVVLRSDTRAKKRLFLPLFRPDFLELEVGDTRMFVLCPAAKIWQIVPPAALQ